MPDSNRRMAIRRCKNISFAGSLLYFLGLCLVFKTPSAQQLKSLLQPGLPSDLEDKLLGIFSNLVSRISGLKGTLYHAGWGGRWESIVIQDGCFNHVLGSQDQFEELMTDATVLAHTQPFSIAASDSQDAAELAIRIEYILKANNCCDSCGGYLYKEPVDINWDDHTVSGIGFSATFNGQDWEVFLNAG